MAAPFLDESRAYGNLPNWVAHGIALPDVFLPPQTRLVNGEKPQRYEPTMLPPLYAGRTTKDTTPRLLEPRMKAQSMKSRSLDAGYPWATDVKPEFRQWSAYNLSPRKQQDFVKLPPMVNGMDGQCDQNNNQAMNNHNLESLQGSQRSAGTWRSNYYNTHAKQGFKFWMEEKKPFSKSSKYTFGSYRTFLGLGNAPRN